MLLGHVHEGDHEVPVQKRVQALQLWQDDGRRSVREGLGEMKEAMGIFVEYR